RCRTASSDPSSSPCGHSRGESERVQRIPVSPFTASLEEQETAVQEVKGGKSGFFVCSGRGRAAEKRAVGRKGVPPPGKPAARRGPRGGEDRSPLPGRGRSVPVRAVTAAGQPQADRGRRPLPVVR